MGALLHNLHQHLMVSALLVKVPMQKMNTSLNHNCAKCTSCATYFKFAVNGFELNIGR